MMRQRGARLKRLIALHPTMIWSLSLSAGGPEEDARIAAVDSDDGFATFAFTSGAAAVERESALTHSRTLVIVAKLVDGVPEAKL